MLALPNHKNRAVRDNKPVQCLGEVRPSQERRVLAERKRTETFPKVAISNNELNNEKRAFRLIAGILPSSA